MAEQRSFTSGGASITVEVFSPAQAAGRRPAVIMLHGADGLGFNPQYRSGAQDVAAAGYQVHLVHYLDRTGERRASFSTVFRNFLPWMGTVGDAVTWTSRQPEVDSTRIGLLGVSLGAALALTVAAEDRRVRAVVDYFGPLPHGLPERARHLPPTLILHGAADPIVPVANAYAIADLLQRLGTPHEIMVYPGQGHGLHGSAELDAGRRVAAFLDRHLHRDSADAAGPLSAAR